MVYLIIGILILLYYLFAAPQSIKGTFNVLSVVLVLVLFIILLVLAAFRIFQMPGELFEMCIRDRRSGSKRRCP